MTAIDFSRWIVLEDFHYLPEETQKDFAVALKAFHESSSLTFIIVGVWLQENRLIQFNGDLSGRVSTINADLWNKSELAEAIRLGEQCVNAGLDDQFKADLIGRCFDSIHVVQEACLLAYQSADIHQRQESWVDVVLGGTAEDIVRRVVERQSARFSDFLINFSTGFGDTELEMY